MKIKNIIVIFIVFILIIMLFANTSIVQATGGLGEVFQKTVDNAKDFQNNGSSNIIPYPNLYMLIRFLYNLVMIVAIVIAIIQGIVLGIRLVFGTIDEKADAKHLIVPYLWIVGAMAFGLAIWRWVIQFVYSII